MFYIINCREFLAFICLKICEILITLDKSVINLSRGTNPSFKMYIKKEYNKSEARGYSFVSFKDALLVP
jgi:hypothetical protein